MDFAYSQEQQMLTESLSRVVKEDWSFEKRRKRQEQAELDSAAWNTLAELGVLGLSVPAEYDGFGESAASLLAIHQELGRGLVSEPVVPSAVMGARILAGSDNEALKQDYLGKIASGETIFSLAYEEGQRNDNLADISTQAQNQDGMLVLSGQKQAVWHAGAANVFIVSALLNGELALLLVPSDTDGIVVQDFPSMDGTRCGNIVFNQVNLDATALLASGQQALDLLNQGLDDGIVALCAHAAGAMDALLGITVEYLKTRQQFGKPLAQFQVLQHRLADMYVQKEVALSMAYVAAAAVGEADQAKKRRMLSSAKVKVAMAGRLIGESAVQLHGGMGMTHELEVGDYFKRLTFIDYLLGDTTYHLKQLEALE